MAWRRLLCTLASALAVAALFAGDVAAAQQSPGGSPSARATHGLPSGAAADISPENYRDGMTRASQLIKLAHLDCDLGLAARLGNARVTATAGSPNINADIYEISCKGGLGYVLLVKNQQILSVADCVSARQSGKLACMLPRNGHPATGLDDFLSKAGVDCVAERARFIAEDTVGKTRQYEVSCVGGGGYVLNTPLADGSGPAPEAVDCLQMPTVCIYTPHVESVAMLAHRFGEEFGDSCEVSDARFVGYIAKDNGDLYELACQSGHPGMLVELSPTEHFTQHWTCGALPGVECKLKPAEKVDPLIIHAERSGANPPMMMTDPDWLQKPNGDDLRQLYPEKAAYYGLAGQTIIGCFITAQGVLRDCYVVDESPLGYGFGEAALKMTAKFKMKPPTEDGTPVDGEHVLIPIRFGR